MAEHPALEGHLAFMVVGAQKAGTTTLHEWLASEPGLTLPTLKETHFFSDDGQFDKGVAWYLSCFDGAGPIYAEVDPDYLSSPGAARRIRAVVGDIPIAILLREPLSRSYSQFQMSTRRGLEKRTFARALADEAQQLARGEVASEHRDYLHRSLYSVRLRTYFDTFSDVRTVRFEDLFGTDSEAKDTAYVELLRFLTGESSRVARREPSVSANAARTAKSGLVASALWDRERFSGLRRVARAVLPTQGLRDMTARRLETWNRSATKPKEHMPQVADLPDDAVTLLREDIPATATLTGLDLTNWSERLA